MTFASSLAFPLVLLLELGQLNAQRVSTVIEQSLTHYSVGIDLCLVTHAVQLYSKRIERLCMPVDCLRIAPRE